MDNPPFHLARCMRSATRANSASAAGGRHRIAQAAPGPGLRWWPGKVVGVGDRLVTLSLGGDVMTGRGVDQVLPHPGDPELRQAYARDALTYVRLAERAHGRIPRSAGFAWPSGEALGVLDDLAPDVRVINLETSITRSSAFAAGRAVHYRMNPGNVPCLAAARPDACALANNHALDFGRPGLQDTLDALSGAGLRAVGAGRDADQARRPVAVPVPGGGRVVIFSCGTASGGIPAGWAATAARPGINLLPDLSDATADGVIGRARAARRPGDVVVVSLHWGSNWGYGVDADQVRFARRLVAGGVDLVHGHSSHHPRPVEVSGARLILYGCGDLINDYEGVAGYPEYRADLRLLYFASLQPGTGALAALRMAPMQARKLRLHRAAAADARWLAAALQEPAAGSAPGSTCSPTACWPCVPGGHDPGCLTRDLARAASAAGLGVERMPETASASQIRSQAPARA